MKKAIQEYKKQYPNNIIDIDGLQVIEPDKNFILGFGNIALLKEYLTTATNNAIMQRTSPRLFVDGVKGV